MPIRKKLATSDVLCGTLIDFIHVAFCILHIKSSDGRIDENFRTWLVSKSFISEEALYLPLLKDRDIAKNLVDIEDFFAPPLSILNVGGLGAELFGEQGMNDVVADLNRSIFQKTSA